MKKAVGNTSLENHSAEKKIILTSMKYMCDIFCLYFRVNLLMCIIPKWSDSKNLAKFATRFL